MLALLFTVTAWCQSAQQVETQLSSILALHAQPELVREIREPVSWTEGPVTYTFASGWWVPIFSGRPDLDRLTRATMEDAVANNLTVVSGLVGFAWVGSGHLSLAFETRGEAQPFANQMVRYGMHDAARLTDVAHHEAPFTTTMDAGFVLTTDPAVHAALLADVPASVFEVVVYSPGSGARQAAIEASALFEARGDLHEDLPGGSLSRRMGWDRMRQERLNLDGGEHFIADMRTASRYGRIMPGPQAGATLNDQWLTLVRDDTGAWGGARRWEVSTIGRTSSGAVGHSVIGGLRFPPSKPGDPTSARLPSVRPEGRLAKVELWVQQAADPRILQVEARARLTIKAVG